MIGLLSVQRFNVGSTLPAVAVLLSNCSLLRVQQGMDACTFWNALYCVISQKRKGRFAERSASNAGSSRNFFRCESPGRLNGEV